MSVREMTTTESRIMQRMLDMEAERDRYEAALLLIYFGDLDYCEKGSACTVGVMPCAESYPNGTADDWCDGCIAASVFEPAAVETGEESSDG